MECREGEVGFGGELLEHRLDVVPELFEVAEQHVGQSRAFEVTPEHLNQVQFGAVMRQPNGVNVRLGLVEVAVDDAGVMWIASIQHQDDPASGPLGAGEESVQKNAKSPRGLPRLGVMQERPSTVAHSSEHRQFAILPRRPHATLFPARHPGPRQVGMKVKLGFVGKPEFELRFEANRPFFKRSRRRCMARKAFSLRLPLRVCLGRRKTNPSAWIRRRSQSSHTGMPVSRCRWVFNRPTLQTVSAYPYRNGEVRSASRSSRRYAGVTLGGRPLRGASSTEASPCSCQRRRMSVMVSTARPVACPTVRALDPSADINTQTARLPARTDGGQARSSWRRVRCEEDTRTSNARLMPAPLARPPCQHHQNYRHDRRNLIETT